MSEWKGILETNERKEAVEELAKMRLDDINAERRRERGGIFIFFVLIFGMALGYIQVLKFEKPVEGGLPSIVLDTSPIADFITRHDPQSTKSSFNQISAASPRDAAALRQGDRIRGLHLEQSKKNTK